MKRLLGTAVHLMLEINPIYTGALLIFERLPKFSQMSGTTKRCQTDSNAALDGHTESSILDVRYCQLYAFDDDAAAVQASQAPSRPPSRVLDPVAY